MRNTHLHAGLKNLGAQIRPFNFAVWTALLAGITLLLSVYLPAVVWIIALLNFSVFVLILLLRYASVLLPRRIPEARELTSFPKVSIHIPTYNEPPDIVIKNLEAIRRLDYPDYEVIVLDNNTTDKSVWEPVQAYCEQTGLHDLKFYHLDQVKGYKAGALDECLKRTSPDADFILVVDADYQVDPLLLRKALAYFHSENTGLVQFPQAYFNVSGENRGLQGEYEHFFTVYMNMANHCDCVLSTGTVSCIRRQALEDAGGWHSATITEDVELGLRLKNAGYQGIYVPEALGYGLMPTDGKALRIQRERWIFGNMQTLLLFLKSYSGRLNLRQTGGVLALLTAWYNFMLIPLLALAGSALADLLTDHTLLQSIQNLSLATIWLSAGGTLLFFIIAFVNNRKPVRHAISSFIVHMGLVWEGAVSWILCLFDKRLGFRRTNKFPGRDPWVDYLPGLTAGILLILSGLACLIGGHVAAGLLALLISPVGLSALYLKKQLYNTAVITTKKLNT